ncbi:MAG: exodeoxyribonuclease VII small subunit [Bacteriovoracaceae bacterium]|nr:exodeoxyribonuclease VII small subunit [Bacteriovoracaceae bacterium]
MKKEKATKSTRPEGPRDDKVDPVELPANFDLEASLQEMEQLTTALENGNLSLAQGLAHFEAGVKLYKECATYLAHAEQKIKVLSDALQAEGWKADE